MPIFEGGTAGAGGPDRLWYRIAGDPDAPAVLMLHGFLGSHATWLPFERRLRDRGRLVMPDLYGHGVSPAPTDRSKMTPDGLAATLLDLMTALGRERFRILGYSMGGRIAIRIAVQAPGRVDRLVLVSASPGISHEGDRARRREADGALADRLEADGVADFVEAWDQSPVFQGGPPLGRRASAQLAHERRRHTAAGLAQSLRLTGAGMQPDGWPCLPHLDMPTLLVAGDRDAKYAAELRRAAASFPHARLAVVSGVGHRVHLEAPGAFIRLVEPFLMGEDPGPV